MVQRVLLLLAAVLSIGCHRPPRALEPLPTNGIVVFQNASETPVSVYLVENGTLWIIGHVVGGETAALRLPPRVVSRTAPDVSLAVVPVGTIGVLGDRGRVLPVAIRSLSEPTENLVRMHWVFSGEQLFSLPRR